MLLSGIPGKPPRPVISCVSGAEDREGLSTHGFVRSGTERRGRLATTDTEAGLR